MAAAVQVAGPVTISVNTGSAGALATLGFTRDNVTPQRHRILVNVPGDQNGGEEGNPIEIQDLQGYYTVHMELTKWDTAVAANVRVGGNPIVGTGAFTAASVPLGGVPAVGSLIYSSTAYYRLLLNGSTGLPMNFKQAIPAQEPYSISLSSKFSVLILDWICYPNASGIIWDTTTS